MLTILAKIASAAQFLPIVAPIIRKITGRKLKFPFDLNLLSQSSDGDIIIQLIRLTQSLKRGNKMDFSKLFPIIQLVYARILRAELIKLIDNPDSTIDDIIVRALDALFGYEGG